MIKLLKWLFFPIVCSLGGDEGGGSGSNMEEEEKRKQVIRDSINRMYGIDAGKAPKPEQSQFTKKQSINPADTSGLTPVGGEGGENLYYDTNGNVVNRGAGGSTEMDVPDVDAYNAALSAWNGEDSEAAAARKAMEGENTKLADATRGYYTDQLGRQYGKAERETRFKLARQGLAGGSEDIFQQGEVSSDRDLGATRLDQAVRSAVANLKTQREQERLNAVSLVNAGAGDSAVSAAQAGLKNSFEVANSQQRANLFDDLFANSADALTANNMSAQQQALLSRYQNQLSTFFPNRGSTTSGRITASA